MMIVVLGPDGSGKSSLIDALAGASAGASTRPVARFHLRPGVFARQRSGAQGPVIDPHGRPPRGPLASAAKLFFLLADYVVGYWLVVRPACAAGSLVIFDRYYHDLLVDPHRYRYGGPQWLARMLGGLVPKPDLWIVLDAPADVLQTRKQEVTGAETARQRDGYLRLAQSLPGVEVVDASQPAERVVAAVERAIVNHRIHQQPMRHGYERR